MHRPVLFLFILLQIGLPCTLAGQKSDYRLFDNISLGTEASVISCFLQDTQGLIWIGSNKGLFSYDGYSSQPHFTFGERSNTRIYCGTVVDSTYLYIGADNGLLIYNYRTDTYQEPEADFPTDIRTLALRDGVLWLGTLNGLYTYSPETRQLSSITEGLPHQTIYSIIRASDDNLYIGTYNGCCRYIPATGRFETIDLPVTRGRSNQFVNSLLEDTARGCIWIGTEGCLFKYTPADGHTQRIDAFHDNSVKSLALDGNGQLLVGTDNGLYVYQETSPCCTLFMTPETSSPFLTISSGPSLPTASITSGWVRITASPCPAITVCCVTSLSCRLPEQGRATSSIPCCAMRTELIGLAAPTDSFASPLLWMGNRTLPGTRWETGNILCPTTGYAIFTKTVNNNSGWLRMAASAVTTRRNASLYIII